MKRSILVGWGIGAFAAARGVLGNVAAGPGRRFYVIDVRIRNHAVRVSYDFRPEVIQVRTPEGAELEASAAGQRALDAQEPPPSPTLPRGAEATYRRVFIGPSTARELSIAFVFGDPNGWLDALVLGRSQIRLPVGR